jgi:hypothetical protein
MKYAGIAAASVIAALALCSDALAAKKMSYEQAWGKCRAEVGASVPGNDTTTSAARYTVGSACMKKYGYRLKKSSVR